MFSQPAESRSSANDTIHAFAALNLNTPIRLASSSGGVFSLLAEKTLQLGGTVYGVRMTDDCKKAVYTRITNQADLEQLRGSKYLQARTGSAFRDAKTDLDEGRAVLFSGTGCIINGFHSFLGKDYAQLLCVDIVCHGVPSPLLWEKNVNDMEVRQGKQLREAHFRCKKNGWHGFGINRNYGDLDCFSRRQDDAYLQLFLSDYCLRPSCYNCKAKIKRAADITLGDFWGIETLYPELDDNLGTSLVICRTAAGLAMFNSIKDQMHWKDVSYEKAVTYNIAEVQSVKKPQQRNTFFIDLNRLPLEKVEKKYLSVPLKEKIKNKLKKLLK